MFTRGSYYNRQPIDPAQLLGNRAGASWELPEPKEKNHCHQLVLRSPLNSILIFTPNKFTCQEQEILDCVSFSFQVVFNTRLSVVNYSQD